VCEKKRVDENGYGGFCGDWKVEGGGWCIEWIYLLSGLKTGVFGRFIEFHDQEMVSLVHLLSFRIENW
jgi:hypothetical protein